MILVIINQVVRALRSCPNPANGNLPTDYLLFLCPGKRELGGEHIDVSISQSVSYVLILLELSNTIIYVLVYILLLSFKRLAIVYTICTV